MALAWTTPTRCGAAALESSSTLTFSAAGYTNLPLADSSGTWNDYNFSSPGGETGDTIKLTDWDIEIPGAGVNVTRMKLAMDASETISSGDLILYVNGHGIAITQKTKFISGSLMSGYSIDATVASWGLSVAEINQLVSNSSTYGLEFHIITDGWNNSAVSIQNVTLSFEYNARRGIYIS